MQQSLPVPIATPPARPAQHPLVIFSRCRPFPSTELDLTGSPLLFASPSSSYEPLTKHPPLVQSPRLLLSQHDHSRASTFVLACLPPFYYEIIKSALVLPPSLRGHLKTSQSTRPVALPGAPTFESRSILTPSRGAHNPFRSTSDPSPFPLRPVLSPLPQNPAGRRARHHPSLSLPEKRGSSIIIGHARQEIPICRKPQRGVVRS
jgi:hypothetical protein